MRIGIVAGEASGDILGASLMTHLKQLHPDWTFVGVGGPEMIAAGCETLYPLESLSVMGLIAPLLRARTLLRCFYGLLHAFQSQRIDAFIGIDAPDFNLRLAKRLKQQGVKTFHWVSPSVWAWRQGRIKTIQDSIDCMMVLFPFEADFYAQHNVRVVFTGHPTADTIPLVTSPLDKDMMRMQLGLSIDKPVLGLMPGSRKTEVHYLGHLFCQTAMRLQRQLGDIEVVVPMVNAARLAQFKNIAADYPKLNIKPVLGQSVAAMRASHALLLASGTAALEAMLCKTPAAIGYKVSWPTYQIAKRLIKVPYVGLPNLLAQEMLMPEFLQQDCQPEKMAATLQTWLAGDTGPQAAFRAQHQRLRLNAGQTAAAAVSERLEG